MQKWIGYCTTAIRWLFYILFFTVPLFFTNNTSELFELNKMWLTFWIALLIFGFWGTKMVLEKQLHIQRTRLDILLLLFLLSQIISTIFSMNSYISWWGYYSRFNGGLLSTITYIFLYYALVTNLAKKDIIRLLWVSVSSCVIVALWGLPAHFGYDPTCYLFRGTFDVSCWTADFKPTVRIFSSLGQPDWMAAYLSIFLPLTIALFINRMLNNNGIINSLSKHIFSLVVCLLLLALFYIDLVFTNTRAGFAGFLIGNSIFWVSLLFTNVLPKKQWLQMALLCNIFFIIITFFYQSPINLINRFTLPSLIQHVSTQQPAKADIKASPTPAPTSSGDLNDGITDSSKIRLYVWQGALAAWGAHPLFGTGVETFAFAYYQYRPIAHNMTSEWDFLYNKAHNEYLNYLATTGIFGLGTYLAYVFGYCLFSLLYVYKNARDPNNRQAVILTIGLLSAFVSILVSNFFGFSVVIINEFLFLIPAFFLILTDQLYPEKSFILFKKQSENASGVSGMQWLCICIIWIVALYYEIIFITYYNADISYALGHNYDEVNQYQKAYPLLVNATNMRPDEPVFQDELSINEAALAVLYAQNKDLTDAQNYASQAKTISDTLTTDYPTNILFWKSRVRIFVLLGSNNPQLLALSLQAIQKAHELAPTDAKILYNLGVLYGQTGNVQKGAKVLEQTIQYKPDYRDAYYALGLFYRDLATDKTGKVIDSAMEQKAVTTMHFILEHLGSNDSDVKKALKSWGEI